MNKAEWKLYWRAQRVARPKGTLLIGDLSAALKELYDYLYTEKQEAFIRLAWRYKDKLDASYFVKIESWKPEAKERASQMFKSLIYGNNPFLAAIKKDGGPGFTGGYVPVPIQYKK